MPAPIKARSDAAETRRHINAVLRQSAARACAFSVLQALCRLSEFDRPEVTITKGQLEREARISASTVRRALRYLRAEGAIVPIQGFVGGRGNAVTYRLCTVGQGGKEPAKATGQGFADLPIWDDLVAACRVSPAERRTWLDPLQPVALEGDHLTVKAPTPFAAKHVRETFRDRLETAAREAGLPVRRISLTS